MENSSDKYLNIFEIEERIEQKLPDNLKEIYQKQIRQTTKENIKERVQSTTAREQHWNNKATTLLTSVLQKLNMNPTQQQQQNTSTGEDISPDTLRIINYAVTAAASAFHQGSVNNYQQPDTTGLESFNRPTKYNGIRDPFVIDTWLRSIEAYGEYKQLTSQQQCMLARTLLTDAANVWFYELYNKNQINVTSWKIFKETIIETFRPANTVRIFRDRINSLTQTSTISNFINEFQTIKLGIPNMTDDEAVDRFIRGLRNNNLKMEIRRLYRNDTAPSLMEAINIAYSYESSSNNNSSSLPSFSTFSIPTDLNDDVQPMDLSYVNQFNESFRERGYGLRGGRGTSSSRGGGFRGGLRGGLRGGRDRSDPRRGGFGRGGFGRGGFGRGVVNNNYNEGGSNYGPRCFRCGQIGHIQYYCNNNRQNHNEVHNINHYDGYAGDEYYYQDNYDYNSYNYYDNNQQQDNNNSPNRERSLSKNMNNDNKIQPSSHYYEKSSEYLYSVLPSSSSFIKPLPIDIKYIKKDVEFVMNANNIHSKLPLYRILINGHETEVLIDSGASANYINPTLLCYTSSRTNINGQMVETANGQKSQIDKIASFSISLGGYTDRIQAFVFDTKFPIILGRSWLRQVQPIPNWFDGSWKIRIRNNPNKLTHIYPLQQIHSIQEVIQKKEVEIQSNITTKIEYETDDNKRRNIYDDEDLDFLLSAKQLESLLKKKKIDECFIIDVSDFYQMEELNVMNSNGDTRMETNEERINREWCDEMAKAYPTVFQEDIIGLPPMRDSVEDMIVFHPGQTPPSIPPYKMSPLELKELRRQLDMLLAKGLIEPCSSPYGVPVIFSRKTSGELRMCCDFRSINKCSISQRIPIPRIDECLEQLHGVTFLSSLDLKNGFHQQRLTESDSKKATINTRYGQFAWKVIPFGLKNSGAQFQKMVNNVLKEYIDNICIVYIDDILIYSKGDDIEVHRKHVHMVIKKLEEAGLIVNRKKCKFNCKKLTFLGYDIIANQGILPSQKKIEAISTWPRPTNVQEVRKFIGLCQYYKSFVPNFSTIAAPITDLTKGSGFKLRSINWTNECQKAFDSIKKSLTSAPVLLTPDMSQPFRIECDASDFGLGAVLLQQDPKNNNQWKPVAYESRKMSSEERNYPAQEKEALSILHALRTWRCFIDGNEYEVYTDHLPLKYYDSTTKISPRLVRWSAELSMYNPKIIYKKGADNIIPDLLSRRDGPKCDPAPKSIEPKYLYNIIHTSYAIMNKVTPLEEPVVNDPIQDWPLFYFQSEDEWPDKWKKDLIKEQHNFMVKDKFIWRKLNDKSKNTNNCVRQEILLKFIPFSKRADLVEDFHRGYGHQGKTTVYQIMKTRVWWPKMSGDISSWLSQCPECQLNSRKETNVHHAPMKPLEIPPPFSRWHLDFIGELPLTKNGNKWILMAVDYNTNWIIARALPFATADEIVKFIYEEIVMRFSCPAEIVTDRGRNFLSKILKQYMRKVRSNHIFTSAFHPRTNSKCERVNQIFKGMLTKYVKGDVHSWDEYVESALFSCRIRKHTTTGFSPFYLVYGVDPVLPGDVHRPFMDPLTEEDPELIAEDALTHLRYLRENRYLAEDRLRIQAQKDKEKWDAALKKNETQEFNIGDYVLLRHESKKGLEFNWMGPYQILKRNLDFNTYQIKEIDGKTYSSWVHTDRLHPVQYDGNPVDKSWYIPRVARAKEKSAEK
jgi:hypothetical protein